MFYETSDSCEIIQAEHYIVSIPIVNMLAF